MRATHLSRSRIASPPDKARIADRMVWTTKRPFSDEGLLTAKIADDTPNAGNLKGLAVTEWRKNRLESPREHGFSYSGWSRKKNVVTTCRGQ